MDGSSTPFYGAGRGGEPSLPRGEGSPRDGAPIPALKYSPHEHINVIQVCRLDQVVPVNENQGSEFALDLFGPEASTLLLLQINGQFPTEQYLPCLFCFHNQ